MQSGVHAGRRPPRARGQQMNQVAVVTDSVACLPPAVAARYSIHLIPVRVRVGEVEYEDLSPDLSPQVVHQLQTEPQIDTTPWPPEHYCRAYLAQAVTTDAIVHVVAFSRFTSTVSLAMAGASMAREIHPGLRIELVDSASTGMAQGFAAIEAARAAQAGGGLDVVAAAAERAVRNTASAFALESLGYLARTGRVGRLYAWAGAVLKVKPVVALVGGSEHPVALARSNSQALRRAADYVAGRVETGAGVQVAVMDSDCPPEARELAQLLSARMQITELYEAPFTPVMRLVAGPGVVGVAIHTPQ